MTPEERLEAVFSGDLFTEDGYQIDHAVFVSMIRAAEADARKAALESAAQVIESGLQRERTDLEVAVALRALKDLANHIRALAAREEKT